MYQKLAIILTSQLIFYDDDDIICIEKDDCVR